MLAISFREIFEVMLFPTPKGQIEEKVAGLFPLKRVYGMNLLLVKGNLTT